jgi:hypothetical protein
MDAPIEFAEDYNEVISAESLPGGGMLYHTRNNGILHGDLGGFYQAKNMNTVLSAVYHLSVLGYLCFCKETVNLEKCHYELQRGIEHVASTTGLMGRWQVIQQNPKVVCDTGHNVGGWQYLSKQLEQQQCHQMHIIFGMVNDKDLDGVLRLLPKNAIYYFTKAESKRAINEHDLQIQASMKHPESAVREAAKAVYDVFSKTPNPTQLNYDDEYGALSVLLSQLGAMDADVLKAARVIEYVDYLGRCVQEFIDASKKSIDVKSKQQVGVLKNAVMTCYKSWQNLAKYLEVMSMANALPGVQDAIDQLNAMNTSIKRRLEARKTNKSDDASINIVEMEDGSVGGVIH